MPEEHPDDARRRRYIERHLGAVGPRNQAAAREFLQLKLAQGVAATSRQHYALYLRRLDQHVAGKRWKRVRPDDVTAFLGAMQLSGMSYATVQQASVHTKAFLTWVHGVERLPLRFRLAFDVKRNRDVPEPQPVPEEDFAKFMDALATIPREPAERLRNQAMAGLMWEAGLRVSELVSLNVGSCRFDDAGGVWLRLPDDGRDLKSGPRSVYVVLYADLLRAWLQAHARRDEPESPVFYSFSPRSRGRRLTKMGVQHVFNRAEKVAGIDHVNTHRLRHTAATRDARSGYMEEDLRAKYGWSSGSKMPGRYVHQSREHQEELARRSVGIDSLGMPVRDRSVGAGALDEAVRAALRRLVDEA